MGMVIPKQGLLDSGNSKPEALNCGLTLRFRVSCSICHLNKNFPILENLNDW
jgi:hypothetical protein